MVDLGVDLNERKGNIEGVSADRRRIWKLPRVYMMYTYRKEPSYVLRDELSLVRFCSYRFSYSYYALSCVSELCNLEVHSLTPGVIGSDDALCNRDLDLTRLCRKSPGVKRFYNHCVTQAAADMC